MHSNTAKEQMSIAHLLQIATIAGCLVDFGRVDIHSTDATIRHIERFHPDDILLKKSIDVQLKATAGLEWSQGNASFELPLKNYNDLRDNSSSLSLLLVYQMPEKVSDWLSHSRDNLISRHCMYWCNIHGKPQTTNKTSVTVQILERNVFSPDALIEMMKRLGRSEELGDVL